MSLESQLVELLERVGSDIGSIMASQQDEQDRLIRIYRDVDLPYAYRFPNDGEEAE